MKSRPSRLKEAPEKALRRQTGLRERGRKNLGETVQEELSRKEVPGRTSKRQTGVGV